jgi:hypothetical protein
MHGHAMRVPLQILKGKRFDDMHFQPVVSETSYVTPPLQLDIRPNELFIDSDEKKNKY